MNGIPSSAEPIPFNVYIMALGVIEWDKLESIDGGIDVFIHLGGESLIGLWTNNKKKRIVDSRVRSCK